MCFLDEELGMLLTSSFKDVFSPLDIQSTQHFL